MGGSAGAADPCAGIDCNQGEFCKGGYCLPQFTCKPVAYWPFDDDYSDLSVDDTGAYHTNHMTPQDTSLGAAPVISFESRVGAGALKFTEGGATICQSCNSPTFRLNTDFTMQLWVFPKNAMSGEENYTLASKAIVSSQADRTGWTLQSSIPNNGELNFCVEGNELCTFTSGNALLQKEAWNHIVIQLRVVDDVGGFPARESMFWVDGVMQFTITEQMSSYETDNAFALGTIWGDDVTFGGFRGRIDEVAVWPCILSSSDIVYLFGAGEGNPVPIEGAP